MLWWGHSLLVVVAHERSSTLRRATYRMQNTMDMRCSPWALAKHETSSPMRRATCWDAKRNIATVSAAKTDTPTTSPTSRAMAPEKCHFPSQIKR